MIESSRSFYNIAPIFRFKIKKTQKRSSKAPCPPPNFGHSFMRVFAERWIQRAAVMARKGENRPGRFMGA